MTYRSVAPLFQNPKKDFGKTKDDNVRPCRLTILLSQNSMKNFDEKHFHLSKNP